jgi:hypothetical protein
MYQGKTNQVAKVWATIGGQQISEIPSGAIVSGGAPAAGYAYINAGSYNGKSWKAGYTKSTWLSNYVEIVVTPPPPPPPDPEVTLKHKINVYSDGSYQVDDGPVIP